MSAQELAKKDSIITPLIYQGQSPYQILTNHPELDMSVRTLYSYLDDGILSARNIDLKRKVKFKPRKVHKTQIKDRTVFNGRTYTDFQALGLDHFAEMDTVHSSRESKRVILTFFLTREKLFLAFIINRCTKGAVKLVFNKLERQMGVYGFLTLFSTILTDYAEFGITVTEALNLAILTLLKQASMTLCVQASIIAILCGAVRKAGSSRPILLYVACCPKEQTLPF